MMKKITLAVLFGGCSTEYAVSLQSAHAVLTHLNREKYEPVPLGITRDGRWLLYSGPLGALLDDTWHMNGHHCTPAVISPDRGLHGLLIIAPAGLSTVRLDAAFPVLHGKNGEDGTVQGLLELAGIPIVGCGTLSSALCMDKDVAHQLAAAAGIPVPPSAVFRSGEDFSLLPLRTAALSYPLFIKPARAGSSFGITRAERQEQLEEAVQTALEHDGKVVIENKSQVRLAAAEIKDADLFPAVGGKGLIDKLDKAVYLPVLAVLGADDLEVMREHPEVDKRWDVLPLAQEIFFLAVMRGSAAGQRERRGLAGALILAVDLEAELPAPAL